MHTAPVVRKAEPGDLADVVDTVVEAFDADPAFRWFFPDPDEFDAQAREFARALFRGRCEAGTAWVVDVGPDRAVATALWEPPGTAPWREPDLPAAAVARLREWEEAVHPLLPATAFWYLGVLATRPAHAGRRLAELAAAPGQALARAAGGAWLETASAANVAMYLGRGWVRSGAVDVGGVGCTVMHRP